MGFFKSLLGMGSIVADSPYSEAEKEVRNYIVKKVLCTGPVGSFVDNVIRETVTPAPGSIVYCDLLAAEHSGIYVGRNRIVHLNGSGKIEKVSPQQFLDRLDGLNTAISIYVSCIDTDPIHSTAIAKRARQMVDSYREYNVLLDNCHQFTAGCVTGDFENSYNFMWMLRHLCSEELDCNEWRVWERS